MTDPTQARIADIVQSSDVMLFMKGTPLFPQCGFSSKAVAILEHSGVPFMNSITSLDCTISAMRAWVGSVIIVLSKYIIQE